MTDQFSRINPIIYLAVPYSHDNEAIKKLRFDMVTEYAARQAALGYTVFSPISHTHPMEQYGLPQGWDFWQSQDVPMLHAADFLVVLKLPGWDKSIGVQGEIELADEIGVPVYYADYGENFTQVLPKPIVKECEENALYF